MKASYVHGQANVIALERAARDLLAIPALPDGANGPRGRAILAQIQADEASMGKDAALRKWARVSTVAYACALDDDPDEHKSASGRTVESLEHPTKKGEYAFPDTARLQAAIADPTARAKCSAAALAALDDHASKAEDLDEEDWKPADKPIVGEIGRGPR
jgi:hypothetical protein